MTEGKTLAESMIQDRKQVILYNLSTVNKLIPNIAITRITGVEAKDIRNAGLKATLPRIRILQILEESGEKHMSAEDIYKKLLDVEEDVGIATVYRVLNQFETAGLVVRHHFDSGHSVYEINQGGHHDHMVCLKTGKVIEFKNDEIEQLQKDIAEKYGYELEDHSLVLYVRPKE